jgi:hypothetical protein
MTTVLLIDLLLWMVGLECRLWINIHRLNEHPEELTQGMNLQGFLPPPHPNCAPRTLPNLARAPGAFRTPPRPDSSISAQRAGELAGKIVRYVPETGRPTTTVTKSTASVSDERAPSKSGARHAAPSNPGKILKPKGERGT